MAKGADIIPVFSETRKRVDAESKLSATQQANQTVTAHNKSLLARLEVDDRKALAESQLSEIQRLMLANKTFAAQNRSSEMIAWARGAKWLQPRGATRHSVIFAAPADFLLLCFPFFFLGHPEVTMLVNNETQMKCNGRKIQYALANFSPRFFAHQCY